MMARDGLTLKGDKKLLRTLKQLPASVEKKVVRNALNKGAGVIKAAVITRAPAPTSGKASIKHNIIVKNARKKRKDTRLVLVGVRNKTYLVKRKISISKRGGFGKSHGKAIAVTQKSLDAGKNAGQQLERINPGNIAHFVEFGRLPVRSKTNKPMVSPVTGEVFGTVAKGVAARSFMRKGYRSSRRQAMRAVQLKLWKGIKEEARKRK